MGQLSTQVRAAGLIFLGALLMTGCSTTGGRAPAPIPTVQSAGGWIFNHGRPPSDLAVNGDQVSFSFNNAEPHMLVRPAAGLSSALRVQWHCEGCMVDGYVSLIIIRSGNNWTIAGDQVNYRWYYAGSPIANGGVLEIPLQAGYWRNVSGQSNPTKFLEALTNASHVGLCFGFPYAGATCHGVTGAGRFVFTWRQL
jgi:hypothetical protein